MKLEIVHSTRYRYSGPIAETVMEVRLRPMDGNGQRCLDFKLELSHGLKAPTWTASATMCTISTWSARTRA